MQQAPSNERSNVVTQIEETPCWVERQRLRRLYEAIGKIGSGGEGGASPEVDYDQLEKAIKYKIKNPLFGTNAGADPKLNNTFDLTSADNGPWGSPVQIPQQINFFVASSKAPGGNSVRFDIFKWDKGQNIEDTFTVSPGDQVGGVSKANAGVDFATDWTLVDFRDDPRQNDTQILLVNNKDGKIMVRSYRGDSLDPLYNGLKEQIKALKAAGPTAGAAAP